MEEWEKHGQGKENYPNGDIILGEFKNDKLNGKGSMTNKHGTTFVGEFKDYKPWNVKLYNKNIAIINSKICSIFNSFTPFNIL